MQYPRQHIIDDPKLKDLLKKKTELVLQGREMSMDIEDIEKGQEIIDKQIQEIEKVVDIKDLEPKSKAITKEFNTVVAKMEAFKKEVYERMKAKVPPELGEKYEKNKKLKEKLENERNKVALKVQKIKDLIVPLTQKVAKSLLKDEFEDFHELRIENDEIVLEIFSHLETWKEMRRKKLDLKQ